MFADDLEWYLQKDQESESDGESKVVRKKPRLRAFSDSSESSCDGENEQLDNEKQTQEEEELGWPKILEAQVDDGACTGPLVLDTLVQVPAPINRFLRAYQRNGISWLYNKFKDRETKTRGCILNDDMGLGKTLQVISLLSALYKKTCLVKDRDVDVERRNKLIYEEPVTCPNTSLIVTPAAVLAQWKKEIDRWCHFSVMMLGKDSKLDEIIRDCDRGMDEILLISYEQVVKLLGGEKQPEFFLIIFDEFHSLRTKGTNKYTDAKQLRAEFKIGLTGTAVQNKLEDAYHLIDVFSTDNRPNPLGTFSEFKESIVKPIDEWRKKHVEDPQTKKRGETASARFKRILSKVTLRRDKRIVAKEMPLKRSFKVSLPLTDLQATTYRLILDQPEIRAVLSRNQDCACGSKKKQGICCRKTIPEGHVWKMQHPKELACDHCPTCVCLSFLDFLNKTVTDLRLFSSSEVDEDHERKEKIKELFVKREATWNDSNKLRWVLETIRLWKRTTNHPKVLIFTQSVVFISLLEALFLSQGVGFCCYHGKMDQKSRLEALREFEEDSSKTCLLMSTKSGGLGLNLTVANKVIIVGRFLFVCFFDSARDDFFLN